MINTSQAVLPDKYNSEADIPQGSIQNYIAAKNNLPRDSNNQTNPAQEIAMKNALMQGQFDTAVPPTQPVATAPVPNSQPVNPQNNTITPPSNNNASVDVTGASSGISKGEAVAKATQDKLVKLSNTAESIQAERLKQQLAQQEKVVNENKIADAAYSFNDFSSKSSLPKNQQAAFYKNRLDNLTKDHQAKANHNGRAIISDFVKGVAVGTLQLANIVPLVANALTSGKVGQDTIKAIQGTINGLNNSESDYLKRQRDQVNKKISLNELRNTVKNINKGKDGQVSTEVKSFLQEAGYSIEELLKNPYLALDLISQQATSLLSGGIVAKGLVRGAEKSIAKKTEKYLARVGSKTKGATLTKAGKLKVEAALAKSTKIAQYIGGTGSEALQEASDVSSQAVNTIFSMTPQDLKNNSSKYNEYLKTMPSKDAIRKLAATVGGETFLAGFSTTAMLSLLTGTGKLRGSLLTKLATKVPKGKLVGAAHEAVKNAGEEFVQGLTTQGTANAIFQAQADKRTKVRSGLGQESGFGVVAGGYIGAGLGAISHPRSNKPNSNKPINTTSALPNGDTPTSTAPKPTNTKNYTIEQVAAHKENITQKLVALHKEIDPNFKPITQEAYNALSPTDKKLRDAKSKEHTAKVRKFTLLNNEYTAVSATLKEMQDSVPKNVIQSDTATKEEKVAATNTLYNDTVSDPLNVSEDAVKVMKQSDNLSEEQSNNLDNIVALNKLYKSKAGNTGKTVTEVSSNIKDTSSAGMMSLQEYTTSITAAVTSGDTSITHELFNRLKHFKTLMQNKVDVITSLANSFSEHSDNTRLADITLTTAQQEAANKANNIFTFGKNSDYKNTTVGALRKLTNTITQDAKLVSDTYTVLKSGETTITPTVVPSVSDHATHVARKKTVVNMFEHNGSLETNLAHVSIFNTLRASVSSILSSKIRNHNNRTRSLSYLAHQGLEAVLVRLKQTNDKAVVTDAQLATVNTEFTKVAKSLNENFTPITQADIADVTAMTYAEITSYKNKQTKTARAEKIAETKKPTKPNEPVKSTKISRDKNKKGFKLVGKPDNPNITKDQAKANEANSFIGYGQENTSSLAYLQSATEQSVPTNNQIDPNNNTVAFVTVNGGNKLTSGAKKNTLLHAQRVLDAGGSLIMDTTANANTPYNKTGEGVIQQALKDTYGDRLVVTETKGANLFSLKNTTASTVQDQIVETDIKEAAIKETLAYFNSKSDKTFYDILIKVLDAIPTNLRIINSNSQEYFPNDPKTGKPSKTPAAYFLDKQLIVFNSNVNLTNSYKYMTMLHELVHAAIPYVDDKILPEHLTAAQVQAVKDIRALFEALQADFNANHKGNENVKGQITYAFSNIDDFIAVALSNTNMKNYLKSKTLKNALLNAYESFKKILMNLIGINPKDATAFDALIDNVYKLLDTGEVVLSDFGTPVSKGETLVEGDVNLSDFGSSIVPDTNTSNTTIDEIIDNSNILDTASTDLTKVEEDALVAQIDKASSDEEIANIINTLEPDESNVVTTVPTGLLADTIETLTDEEIQKRDTNTPTTFYLKFKTQLAANSSILHLVKDVFKSSIYFVRAANKFIVKILHETALTAKDKNNLADYHANISKISTLIKETLNVTSSDVKGIEDGSPIRLLTDTNGNLLEGVADAIAVASLEFVATDSYNLLNPTEENLLSFLGLDKQGKVPAPIHEYLRTKGMPMNFLAAQLGRRILASLNITTRGYIKHNVEDKLVSSLGDLALNALLKLEVDGKKAFLPTTIIKGKLGDESDTMLGKVHTDIYTEAELADINTIASKFDNTITGIIPSAIDSTNSIKKPLDGLQKYIDNVNAVFPILNKIFSLGSRVKLPLFTKPTNKDITRVMKNSNRQVSPQQIKALKIMSRRPQSIKQDMLELYESFSLQEQEYLLGKHTEQDILEAHVDERKGMIGKNLSIDNDIKAVKEFLESLPDGNRNTPFYLLHNVGKLLRMTMTSNTINPQQSHLHRHLFQSKYLNEGTLHITGSRRSPQHKAALLAVAAAFNIKVENMSVDEGIAELDKILTTPQVKKAIKMLQDTTTPLNNKELIDVAKSFGSEPIHALEGLKAIAAISTAKAKAQKYNKAQDIPFTLFFEIDGKNSGAWLSKAQLASEQDAFKLQKELTKGGASFDGVVPSDSDYYKDYARGTLKGMYSAYQDNIAEQEQNLKKAETNTDIKTIKNKIQRIKKSLAAFTSFQSEFFITQNGHLVTNENGEPMLAEGAIRAFGKIGLLPANYGSGAEAQSSLIAGDILDKVRRKLSTLAKQIRLEPNEQIQKTLITTELADLLQTMDDLQINTSKKYKIRFSFIAANLRSKNPVSVGVILNLLDPANENGILNMPLTMFNHAYVKSAAKAGTKSSLQAQQGNIIRSRELIMLQAKTIINLYNSAMRQALDKFVATGIPTKDEFKKIQNDLLELYPAFHNYFSFLNHNINQGTSIHGKEYQASKDKRDTVTTPMKGMVKADGTEKTGNSARQPFIKIIGSSGLGAYIGNILSLDATIASLAQLLLRDKAGLNIHDAMTLRIDDVVNGTPKDINRITQEVLTSFDVMEQTNQRLKDVKETYKTKGFSLGDNFFSEKDLISLSKQVNSLSDYTRNAILKNTGTTDKFVEGAFDSLTTEEQFNVITELSDTLTNINSATLEGGLKEATGLNQYASPFGEYDTNQDNTESNKHMHIKAKYFHNEVRNLGMPRRITSNKFNKAKKALEANNAKKDDAFKNGMKLKVKKGKRFNQDDLSDSEQEDILNSKVGNLGKVSNDASKASEASNFDTIDSSNAIEIFDSLGKTDVLPASKEHSAHLRNILSNLLTTVIDPIELAMGKTEFRNKGYYDTTANKFYMDVITELPATGRSGTLGSYAMSQQELFVKELLSTLSINGLKQDTSIRKELNALYKAAKNRATIEMFIPETTAPKGSDEYTELYNEAKVLFDKVFSPMFSATSKRVVNPITGVEHIITQSNHLSEFFNMALTNPTMMKLVNSIKFKQENNVTLMAKVKSLLSRMLNVITKKLLGLEDHTLKSDGYLSLVRLAASLSSDMQRIKQAKASADTSKIDFLDKATERLHNTAALLRKSVGKPLSKSSYEPVAVLGKLIDPANKEMTVDVILNIIDEFRTQFSKDKEGIINEVISDIRGATPRTQEFQNLFLQQKGELDHKRNAEIHAVKTVSTNSYTRELTKAESTVLTKFILKYDFNSLHGRMSQKDLIDLSDYLTDPAKLKTKIAEVEAKITALTKDKFNTQDFILRMSESLGAILVHGKPTEHLFLNKASDIISYSKAANTPELENLIDELASLHAIAKSNTQDKVTFNSLIHSETKGVTLSLRLHKAFKQQSKSSLAKEHLQKGYTKDITNPHIGVAIATLEDGKFLEKLGYVKVSKVQNDVSDTNKSGYYVYKNAYGGRTPLVSGLLSPITYTAAGTDIIGLTNKESQGKVPYSNILKIAQARVNNITRRKARVIASIHRPRQSKPELLSGVLRPIVDPSTGAIVNYSYGMSTIQRESLLETNSDFHSTIAGMFGANVTKASNSSQLNKVSDLIISKFKERRAAQQSMQREIFISTASKDSYIRNFYNSLPLAIRNKLSKGAGKPDVAGFYIPKETLNLIIGTPKFNILDVWTMPASEQRMHHRVLMKIAEAFLGNKAPKHLKTITELLESMTSLAKTNVIVRGYLVTAYNYLSNVNTLRMSGIPLKTIFREHILIYKQAKEYQDNAKELARLELRFKMGNSSKVLQDRVKILKSELDSSTLNDSIKAGMLTTIVEDIEPNKDIYGYKTKLNKEILHRTEVLRRAIPNKIKALSSEFFMMEGSTSFEMANNLLHLSDFTARQIYINHVTKRVKKPLPPKLAFEKAMNLFVAFDLPTNKYIQAGNDLGFLWYTKFLFRNMKARFQLMTDNPENVLAYEIMELADIPFIDSILDSSITPSALAQRVGFAPMALLDSIPEIAPLNLATSLTPTF